jgi:hypothetical protein
MENTSPTVKIAFITVFCVAGFVYWIFDSPPEKVPPVITEIECETQRAYLYKDDGTFTVSNIDETGQYYMGDMNVDGSLSLIDLSILAEVIRKQYE